MAEQTLRKLFIKKFGLPGNRKGFLGDFDGDSNALSELQLAIEQAENPELQSLWDEATSGAASDDDVVAGLADALYGPQKSGVRGKKPDAPEKIEGNLPPTTNKADSQTLDATPYESLSNSDKTLLTSRGFPAKDISGWTESDLQSTLDGLRSGGGGKKAAAKPAAASKQAAGKSAAPAAATPATPAATPPADRYADVEQYLNSEDAPAIGGMGATRSDLEAFDEPIPGAMGLTRADVANYVTPDGMLGDPVDAPAPAMDMSRLGAAAAPQPAQPQMPMGMSIDDQIAALSALDPPSQPKPLGGLLEDPTIDPVTGGVRVVYGPEPPPPFDGMAGINSMGGVDGGYGPPPPPFDPMANIDPATGGAMGGGYGPELPPFGSMEGINSLGGVDGEYGPPRPESLASAGQEPFRPVTSRVDAFMKARGLEGMNTGAVTKPIDWAIRNSPWLVPAGAGGYMAHSALSGSQEPPAQEEMDELARRRDAARAKVEQLYGGFTEPAFQPPKGRSL